jgi:hypothetical protein
MRRNLTFVNLQSAVKPEPSPSKSNLTNNSHDIDGLKEKHFKQSSTNDIWRTALANSRRKRTNSLNNGPETPPSHRLRKAFIVKENVTLNPNSDSDPTPNSSLAIAVLATMFGIILYAINNTDPESTKNTILSKLRIG